MEKLIWYSIPGALYMLAIGLIKPDVISGVAVAATISSVPVVGLYFTKL